MMKQVAKLVIQGWSGQPCSLGLWATHGLLNEVTNWLFAFFRLMKPIMPLDLWRDLPVALRTRAVCPRCQKGR